MYMQTEIFSKIKAGQREEMCEMKTVFDNRFWQFMAKAADFIALNLLFTVTCLPVITIGTSLSALYSVTIKEADTESAYLIKGYLSAWKRNFKEATPVWLLHLGLIFLFLFSFRFWYSLKTGLSALICTVLAAASLVLVLSIVYTYPLIARYKNTRHQTLKNSILIPLSNPIPTVKILAILVFAVTMNYFLRPLRILTLLTGFSFTAYCCSFVFLKLFHHLEGKQ